MLQDASPDWVKDDLGERFVKATLHFPKDYDGRVTATIVRNRTLLPRPTAALYLHGFLDYFFQEHLADAFNASGYNFYALDLRKYGRSMGSAEHPNFCKRFEEYFPEITAAIDIITTVDRQGSVMLMAHSTGALPAVLYARGGDRRNVLTSVILNSPFLEMPQGSALGHVGAMIGWVNPFGPIRNPVSRWYGESLHADYKGEWHFNTTWKPIERAVAFFGWVRAVVSVQDRIKRGLGLDLPILVMHSDRSAKGDSWSDTFHYADLILNVEHIKQFAPRLGRQVVLREIPGGKHDLTLSRQEPRELCLRVIGDWLSRFP